MTKPIGRFVNGSIPRHLADMSLTGAVGTVMVFLADFINVFFVAKLGVIELTAAIGFAATVLFFVRSVAVALGIATSVLVSRQFGANNRHLVRRYIVNAGVISAAVTALVCLALFPFIRQMLALVGASGETLRQASAFLTLLLPTTPLLAIGFCGGQIIRANGQARLSMWISVAAAIANIALAPLCIFTLGFGLSGAAWATIASQLLMALLAWGYILRRPSLVRRFSPKSCLQDIPAVLSVAVPAMLTNLASPVSAAFAARQMAQFGDDAVAAFTVIMRLIPLTLAVVFSLSGAIAPIIGQNAGAGQFDRVRQTASAALQFNWLMVCLASLALYLLKDHIPLWFSLSGEAAALLVFFCLGLTLFFGFDGMVFCANAAFNNLNRPLQSTWNNFARVFLGSIPLVWLGQHYFGTRGVLLGYMAKSIFIAPVSWWILMRLILRYQSGAIPFNRKK